MKDKKNCQPSDEELVKTFLQGDEESFRKLVDRYQSPLLNYIYRFTGNRATAEEIIQDTFMSVFKNIGKFNPTYPFRSWIYAIATNRAMSCSKRHRELRWDEDEEPPQKKSADFSEPLQNVSELERAQAVQTALDLLPEKQRAIFILRFYQMLSYEEIALAMGCPLGTVKSRMCYAIRRLRGILWPHRDESS